ncbi:hypothetical protein JCM24511_07151 [Saitozyma sp. JCM 24511]|nr:hypothetical protein JCM24511_07151 [Saitozyma sp. JCM 24511]
MSDINTGWKYHDGRKVANTGWMTLKPESTLGSSQALLSLMTSQANSNSRLSIPLRTLTHDELKSSEISADQSGLHWTTSESELPDAFSSNGYLSALSASDEVPVRGIGYHTSARHHNAPRDPRDLSKSFEARITAVPWLNVGLSEQASQLAQRHGKVRIDVDTSRIEFEHARFDPAKTNSLGRHILSITDDGRPFSDGTDFDSCHLRKLGPVQGVIMCGDGVQLGVLPSVEIQQLYVASRLPTNVDVGQGAIETGEWVSVDSTETSTASIDSEALSLS